MLVTVGERPYAIDNDWTFRDIRASGTCNGKPFTAQIERHGSWLRVAHNGMSVDALVLPPRAANCCA